ncbi:hypothetical protein DL762_001077 [Monosporascus cannonballus]|uniref:serine--tRNA ligase n=1 Tax=Monosporascus cannonballus TaxID=155416 RepID=A0ABY0HJN4_9PEZI|nr:hypothetical protein DL762_001077 [Monosporascus cannonballus]
MRIPKRPFICAQCRLVRARSMRPFHGSIARLSSSGEASQTNATSYSSAPRPTTAPRPNIDIKHIRQNATLYAQNCLERNYRPQSEYPARISALFEEWQARQRDARGLRERSNLVRRQIANPASIQHEGDDEGGGGGGGPPAAEAEALRGRPREALLEEARELKRRLSAIEEDEARLEAEMEDLALAIPNLTSAETPRGDEPRVLSYINDGGGGDRPDPSSSDRVWRSHVHVGSELGLLDFAGAATSSGWGWYYLLDEGAQLEQALIQYALAVVARHGWRRVAPPSVVYSHIAAACGFQPRAQNGEQQVYALSRGAGDAGRGGRPELCLAGTAEIPLAGLKANATLEVGELPLRTVGVSRCYRAEAGARGADTKGLYRVHEFSKVEMFAWTPPSADLAAEVFDEMLDVQTEILGALGLRCRVLEMPSADLGASASRKCDIEAYFPSRRDGWGEVTSASICGDYQTRRLATRARVDGRMTYPWTVNGTALAVPRVLAALLENGWDEDEMSVTIPECLRPWMDGKDKIRPKHQRKIRPKHQR